MNRMLYEQPRLYNALYDRFTEDISFYLDVARASGGRVCELACGTGRVTVPLAREGIEIVGVDKSAAMLDAARDRSASAHLSAENPQFLERDMCDMNADDRFELVLIPLHSLSHLHDTDEVVTCLSNIRRTLSRDGTLCFALHNPDPRLLARESDSLERIHREIADVVVYERCRYRADRQILDLTWYLESAEETTMVEYGLRMFFPEEIRFLLRSAGFSVVERYGWYDRTPFSADSGTQIIVARAV